MSDFWLRRMHPADLPAVFRACRAQNRRDGTSYGVPRIFDASGHLTPNVALALSMVDSRGRVHGGHVFERTLEMMSFGGGTDAIESAVADHIGVFYELRALGYQNLHIQVPKQHVAELEEVLTKRLGTARDDDKLAHFYREL